MPYRLWVNCIVMIILWFSTATSAAELHVPGEYATIAAAVAAANSGDIITIAAGEYTSGIVTTIADDNITLRGENGLAHLNADGLSIGNGKAIFVVTGDNITMENIEFSHCHVNDNNGAGIRHEGGILTIRNCYFHDNENGILTSQQGAAGELIVENSEFNHNGLGSAGYTHNIYVGKIGRFVFRYSYSHHATHGHNIKSRAQHNYILYSRIMDESDGNASYQIDLPNGGRSYIIGNSIHQGQNAENSRMISYAAEGAVNQYQELYVSGNSFVNDRSIGYGIRLSGSPTAVVVNNIFDNLSKAVEGSTTKYAGNLETSDSGFVDRDSYDYHLTSSSAARDGGVDAGSYYGINLQPEREYVHPQKSRPRPEFGMLDIGAFEYSSSTPPPPPPGDSTIVAPVNHLLLR